MKNQKIVYEARIKLFTARDEDENKGIINKLKRKIRKLEQQKVE